MIQGEGNGCARKTRKACKDYLIVRCTRERHAECLKKARARVFDVTGKPMSGWVMVAPDGVEDDSDLSKWIKIGDEYASSLPSKKGRLNL